MAEARDGPRGVPRVPDEPVVQDVVAEERRVVIRGEPQVPDELAVLDVLAEVPGELPDAPLVLDEPVVQDVVAEERRVVIRGEPQVPDELAVLDVLAEVPGELPNAPLVLDAADLSVWVLGEPEAPDAVLVERVPEFLDEPAVRGVSPVAGSVPGAGPSSCLRVSAVALAVADWAQGAGTAAEAVAVRACFLECEWPVLQDAGLAVAGRAFEARAVALP